MIERDLANALSRQEVNEILTEYDVEISHFSKFFSEAKDSPRTLHKLIDEAIVRAAKKDPNSFNRITCQKGCSHCCHTVVSVTEGEARLLINTAKEKGLVIDWEKVRKQAWHSKNPDKYFDLDEKLNACVFLDQGTGTCLVYEDRPASCRKYFVVSDPGDCSKHTEVPGDQVTNWIEPKSELMTSGAFDMDHARHGSLQAMLLKANEEEG